LLCHAVERQQLVGNYLSHDIISLFCVRLEGRRIVRGPWDTTGQRPPTDLELENRSELPEVILDADIAAEAPQAVSPRAVICG
jgi:hypothetical protein